MDLIDIGCNLTHDSFDTDREVERPVNFTVTAVGAKRGKRLCRGGNSGDIGGVVGQAPQVHGAHIPLDLAPFGGETLLVELHAVSDTEVPGARPRPATRDIADVRADIDQVLIVVDQ